MADYFANGALGKPRTCRALDHGGVGAFINYNSLGDAVEIASGSRDIVNDSRAIEDRGVVYNEHTWTDWVVEVVNVDKKKYGGRRDISGRTTGSPANVIRAFAPNDPGGRPFGCGHPDPTIGGITNPGAVVVTGPGPRFVADPIPTAIGPFPIASAIGPPANSNVKRMPAATVRHDRFPVAVRGERGIEIRWGTDLEAGGERDRGVTVGCP